MSVAHHLYIFLNYRCSTGMNLHIWVVNLQRIWVDENSIYSLAKLLSRFNLFKPD